MNRMEKLHKKGLVFLPKELKNTIIYEVITGSVSYGTQDTAQKSDIDLVAVCVPSKSNVFPHLNSEIIGFGKQTKQFTTWQKHHIFDTDSKQEYDLTAYGIVKFFDLCFGANPNLLDILYCPLNCVTYTSQVGELIRENKKLFLSKLAHKTHVGYSYSQLHKLRTKVPKKDSKRYNSYKVLGYDSKYAMHLCRLLLQCEQILVEHDLDLRRNKELLKSVRRGDWSLEQVEDFFARKEKSLGEVKLKSTLREKPDEDKIKALLLECLEMHYGNLESCVKVLTNIEKDMKRIVAITNKYI